MVGEPSNPYINKWLNNPEVGKQSLALVEEVRGQLIPSENIPDLEKPIEESSPDLALRPFDESADSITSGAQQKVADVIPQLELFVTDKDKLNQILAELETSGRYESWEVSGLKRALTDAQNTSLGDLAEVIHKDPAELKKMKSLLIERGLDSVDSMVVQWEDGSNGDIDMRYRIEKAYYEVMEALGRSYTTRNTGKEGGYSISSLLSITNEDAGARGRKVELFSRATERNIKRFASGQNYYLKRQGTYDHIFHGNGERVLTEKTEGALIGLIEFERGRIEQEVTDSNYRESDYSTTERIRTTLGSAESGLILGCQLVEKGIISEKSLGFELLELERNMSYLNPDRFGKEKPKYLDYVKAGYILSKIGSTDWYDTPVKIVAVKQIVESLKDEELKTKLKTQIIDQSSGEVSADRDIALTIITGQTIEGVDSEALQRQVEAVNSAESDLKRETVRELVFGENRVTLFERKDYIDMPLASGRHEKLELGTKLRARYLQNQATFIVVDELVRTAQADGDGYDWADVNVILEKIDSRHGLESIGSTHQIQEILNSEISENQKKFFAQFIVSGLMTNKIQGREYEKITLIKGLLDQNIMKVDDVLRAHNAVLETLSVIGGFIEPGEDIGLQFSDLLINEFNNNLRSNIPNRILTGSLPYGESVDLDGSVRVFVADRMRNIIPYRYKDYTKREGDYYMPSDKRKRIQQEVKTDLDGMTRYLELQRVIGDPEGKLISSAIMDMKPPYIFGAGIFAGMTPAEIIKKQGWNLTEEDTKTPLGFRKRVHDLLGEENQFVGYLNGLSTQQRIEPQQPAEKKGWGRLFNRNKPDLTSPDTQQQKPDEEIRKQLDGIETTSNTLREDFESFLERFAEQTFLKGVDPTTGNIQITGIDANGGERGTSTANKSVLGLSESDIAKLVGDIDMAKILLGNLPSYQDRRTIEMDSPIYSGTQYNQEVNGAREAVHKVTRMFDNFSGDVSGRLREVLASKLQELYKTYAPGVLEKEVEIKETMKETLPLTFVRQLERIFKYNNSVSI